MSGLSRTSANSLARTFNTGTRGIQQKSPSPKGASAGANRGFSRRTKARVKVRVRPVRLWSLGKGFQGFKVKEHGCRICSSASQARDFLSGCCVELVW